MITYFMYRKVVRWNCVDQSFHMYIWKYAVMWMMKTWFFNHVLCLFGFFLFPSPGLNPNFFKKKCKKLFYQDLQNYLNFGLTQKKERESIFEVTYKRGKGMRCFVSDLNSVGWPFFIHLILHQLPTCKGILKRPCHVSHPNSLR